MNAREKETTIMMKARGGRNERKRILGADEQERQISFVNASEHRGRKSRVRVCVCVRASKRRGYV